MADNVVVRNEAAAWTPPDEGEYTAALADVIDLGVQDGGQYGPKHKIAFVFQLDAKSPDTGKRFEINDRYTLSMHEKAKLRQFLGMWRGRPYSEAEASKGVPLDKLVGINAIVTIVHNVVGEKTYANIFNIRPVPRGAPLLNVVDYTRSPRWAEKRQEAAGGKMSPPATNKPVARDAGRPQPVATGPGLLDTDVPPDEDTWPGADEDDTSLPF